MNRYRYAFFLVLVVVTRIIVMGTDKPISSEDGLLFFVFHLFIFPPYFMYFYSKSVQSEVLDKQIEAIVGEQFEQNWNIKGSYEDGSVENFTPEHKNNKGPHVVIDFYRRQARECAKNGEFEKAALNINVILERGMENNWDLKMSYIIEMVDYYIADKNDRKALDTLYGFLGCGYHPNISIRDPLNMMQAYEALYKIDEMQLNFDRGLEYRLKSIYYNARIYIKNKEKEDLKEYISVQNITRILTGNRSFDMMDETSRFMFLKELSRLLKYRKTKCEEASRDIIKYFFDDIAA